MRTHGDKNAIRGKNDEDKIKQFFLKVFLDSYISKIHIQLFHEIGLVYS